MVNHLGLKSGACEEWRFWRTIGIKGEPVDLPVGACFRCLKGSLVKKDPEMAYGKCMGCGRTTDCVSGASIQLFVPYIPLQPFLGTIKEIEDEHI